MASIALKTVDVFTSIPFLGNPVAVALDGSALDAEHMQRIARWTNLSETTFIVPVTRDGADYHVRIFTPGGELPFAGHPTIGTAHALLEAGMVEARDGMLVQQCAAGLVKLQVGYDREASRWIAFELPAPTITALDAGQAAELEAILEVAPAPGAPPCLVDVGARWVVARLPDADAVLACAPDLQRMAAHDRRERHTGMVIFGPYGAGSEAAIEVRAFAPAHGVNEDPVCGSGNGALAAWLRHSGQAGAYGHSFLASQGRKLGRAGRLRLSIADDAILVGGNAVTCIDGSLRV